MFSRGRGLYRGAERGVSRGSEVSGTWTESAAGGFLDRTPVVWGGVALPDGRGYQVGLLGAGSVDLRSIELMVEGLSGWRCKLGVSLE